jgi:glycosyltransferase involved in cell wall biosynthesis
LTPSISVVTPAYQRADTLPRLYDSLREQTLEGFEWVVVDDGSTDETGELVAAWVAEAPFPIAYHRQENRGKHAAFNECVRLASGEFCALIDSDDWYRPEALAGMLATWESIPVARRGAFANVEGLRTDPDGNLVGDRFPADILDSNNFELETVHGVHGDTIGMYRRDVLRRFPFPEDLGWHVSPSLVWNRIAARHDTRFVNQIWAYTDYGEGGLSDRGDELRLRFADAALVYWREFAAMPRPMPAKARFRAEANVVRYSLFTGRSLRGMLVPPAAGAWRWAALPAGVALYGRDRALARRLGTKAGG